MNQGNSIESPEINVQTHGQLIFSQGVPVNPVGKGKPLQQMVLTKLDLHLQKYESEPLPLTSDKNKVKVDQRSKSKTSNYKTAPGKHWGKSGRHWGRERLLK